MTALQDAALAIRSRGLFIYGGAAVLPRGRLVDAIRVAAHRIARRRKRARAAASADRIEFTHAAFAFELGIVANVLEQSGVSIDIRERRRANVAADEIQKAAGLYVPGVGNEHHALAVVHAQRRAQNLRRRAGGIQVGRAHRFFANLREQFLDGNTHLGGGSL